jgi:hypothetical protein
MRRVSKSRWVLPGFGLTMRFTLLFLGLIVLIPLSTVLLKTAMLGWGEFWGTVTAPRTLAAYRLSLGAAWIAASVNVAPGLLVAWMLVRYRFPGVTVHVVEAKGPYPAVLQVVKSAPYGRAATLAIRAMGAHAAGGAGADCGAGGDARPAAGRSRAIEGDGRSIGTSVGAHLAELFAASLGRPTSGRGRTATPRTQWPPSWRAAWP